MSNLFSKDELESWRKWAENNKRIVPRSQATTPLNQWKPVDSYIKNVKSSCSSCNRRRYL